jgi:hypothetical protein
MALLLSDPRVLQLFFLAIREPFHNSYTNSTHNPSYSLYIYCIPVLKKLEFAFSLTDLYTPVLSLQSF